MELVAGPDPSGRSPSLCFATTRRTSRKSLAVPLRRPTPKDGVNDHVVGGAATVNPERRGTKVACWNRITIGAGETTEITLRLARDTPGRTIDLGEAFTQTPIEPGFRCNDID
jgi:hypothetical protein